MNAKLTLTIEESLVKKAKRYAQAKKRSLSDLVENYFRILAEEGAGDEDIELTPAVRSLMGSFKAPEDFDYKKVLQEEIVKRHG